MIDEKQENIIASFTLLENDKEMMLEYLIEKGEALPTFPEELRKDEYLVKGCQSKVWLVSYVHNKRLHFHADSNTVITKGLVALLVEVFEDSSFQQVLEASIFFPERMGMSSFIGTQRNIGFAMMIKKIQKDTQMFYKKINI